MNGLLSFQPCTGEGEPPQGVPGEFQAVDVKCEGLLCVVSLPGTDHRELCEFTVRGCSSVNAPEPAATVSYLCLKNTHCSLGGEVALSSQECRIGQGFSV